MNCFTALQILESSLIKFQNKENWQQGFMARDSKGEECEPTSPSAQCFCGYGAMMNVIDGRKRNAFVEAVGFLRKAIFAKTKKNMSIIAYNDSHSHAEVVSVWRVAIALAKSNT